MSYNTTTKSNRFKSYVSDKAGKVKSKAKSYGNELYKAYTQGFQDGYNAYDKIPQKAFSISSATYGYKKGLKAKKGYNKSQKNLNRYK